MTRITENVEILLEISFKRQEPLGQELLVNLQKNKKKIEYIE